MQKVIEEEGLLANCRTQGDKLYKLLQDGLTSPNALAAPFVFDIRGGGGFWGIEFDFTGPEASSLNTGGKQFGGLVQAKALQNGLVLIGMSGGANVEGTSGDHLILAPPYNITSSQVEEIVKILVQSVEEVLRECGYQ